MSPDIPALKERLSKGELQPSDIPQLIAILDLVIGLRAALDSKKIQVLKWLRRIFGLKTDMGSQKGRERSPEVKEGPSGRRGRNGRDDYPGAKKIKVPHPDFKTGDQCPECLTGKLKESEPGVDYDWQGHPPLTLDVYLLQRFLCPICKLSFTAPSPVAETAKTVDDSGAGSSPVGRCDKNAMANAVVAIFRFWFGIATYRLAKIQGSLGIGLPESSQYAMIKQVYEACNPVYDHLIFLAAQGRQIYADDTWIKIYAWLSGKGPPTQKGTPRKKAVTTAIVSRSTEGQEIVLYLTGGAQAGANVKMMLDKRHPDLEPPQYMTDGLAANKPDDAVVIQLHCLDHVRRRFYEFLTFFPADCGLVIELLKEIYKAERKAKIELMTPSERLSYHKAHSAPVMEKLGKWMAEQLHTGRIEPNSDLGGHIAYTLNRWSELNEFCNIEGADISNSICERVIKSIIRHRKNSLAYKTEKGAHQGDVIQSLIATCERSKINFFKYLDWLQRNKSKVAASPEAFTPWAFAALNP